MPLAVLLITALAAQPIDPRLATMQTVFVAAHDDLADDRPVATCVAERLGRFTPLVSASSRDEADVILTVRGASVGRHPKARMTATLPDGALIWEGGSRVRGFNLVGRNMTCVIAEDLIKALRNAMRKARPK